MTKTVCHYSIVEVIFPNAAPFCGAEFWDAITDNKSVVTCPACKTLLVELFPDELGDLVGKLTKPVHYVKRVHPFEDALCGDENMEVMNNDKSKVTCKKCKAILELGY